MARTARRVATKDERASLRIALKLARLEAIFRGHVQRCSRCRWAQRKKKRGEAWCEAGSDMHWRARAVERELAKGVM